MKFETRLTPSSVYMSRTPFSNIPHWAQWSQRKWNIICTMMMYRETLYRRHTAHWFWLLLMLLKAWAFITVLCSGKVIPHVSENLLLFFFCFVLFCLFVFCCCCCCCFVLFCLFLCLLLLLLLLLLLFVFVCFVCLFFHYKNMPFQIYRKFHLQELKIFR